MQTSPPNDRAQDPGGLLVAFVVTAALVLGVVFRTALVHTLASAVPPALEAIVLPAPAPRAEVAAAPPIVEIPGVAPAITPVEAPAAAPTPRPAAAPQAVTTVALPVLTPIASVTAAPVAAVATATRSLAAVAPAPAASVASAPSPASSDDHDGKGGKRTGPKATRTGPTEHGPRQESPPQHAHGGRRSGR
jgi:hypothetical protein